MTVSKKMAKIYAMVSTAVLGVLVLPATPAWAAGCLSLWDKGGYTGNQVNVDPEAYWQPNGFNAKSGVNNCPDSVDLGVAADDKVWITLVGNGGTFTNTIHPLPDDKSSDLRLKTRVAVAGAPIVD